MNEIQLPKNCTDLEFELVVKMLKENKLLPDTLKAHIIEYIQKQYGVMVCNRYFTVKQKETQFVELEGCKVDEQYWIHFDDTWNYIICQDPETHEDYYEIRKRDNVKKRKLN